MSKIDKAHIAAAMLLAGGLLGWTRGPSAAEVRLEGQVQAGGGPIAKATVNLWAAGPGAPQKLSETQTADHGSFDLESAGGKDDAGVLYLIAKGGEPKVGGDKGPNPAITLMATLGTTPPTRATINELTSIASAWTGAQFLNGIALGGKALGLRIAAGNVPNLVDLETGGLGPVIQDPLNSSQTSTLATFNTLANLLTGCITRVQGDACDKLFSVATPPGGVAPTDTLTAAQNIARNPTNQAQKLFALLDAFYPVPAGENWRPAPFIPYLSFVPSAWTLSLVYAGGGLNSLGGIAIDGEGNMWADDKSRERDGYVVVARCDRFKRRARFRPSQSLRRGRCVLSRRTLTGPLPLEDAEQLGRIDREAAVVRPLRRKRAFLDGAPDVDFARSSLFRRFLKVQRGHCAVSHEMLRRGVG